MALFIIQVFHSSIKPSGLFSLVNSLLPTFLSFQNLLEDVSIRNNTVYHVLSKHLRDNQIRLLA